MLNLFAKTYEYSNGNCVVDGVVQSTTEQCDNIINAFWNIGIGFLVFLAILAVISLIFFVFWIIQIVHVIKHDEIKDRTMWIILLIAGFFLGFLWIIVPIYYFAVMRKYNKQQPAPGASQQENIQPNPKV